MLDPVAMGAAIQADLAKVGLKVKIETYEWNTFLGKVNPGLEGKADMAEMSWMTNDPDTLPYLALRSEATPDKGGFNSGYYSNPKVDELLEAARRETDKEERAKLYKQMQAIVHDDAPMGLHRQLEAECGHHRRRRGVSAGAFLLPAAEGRRESPEFALQGCPACGPISASVC